MQRLDHTRFVIGELHRDQRHRGIEQVLECVEVDDTRWVHRCDSDLLAAGCGGLEDRRVLHGANDHGTGTRRQRTQHRQVVRLRPARGERDASGVNPDQLGQGVPRLVHRLARRSSHLVRAGRIAEPIGDPGQHRGGRGRVDGTSGSMVEVRQHTCQGSGR